MIDVSILDWLRVLFSGEPGGSPGLVSPARGAAAATVDGEATPGPAASGDRLEVSDRTRRLRLESRVRDTVLAERPLRRPS